MPCRTYIRTRGSIRGAPRGIGASKLARSGSPLEPDSEQTVHRVIFRSDSIRPLCRLIRASPWAAACLHAQAAAAPSNQPAQSRAAAAPASQPAEATCLPGRRRRPTFLCPSRQQEIPNGSQGLVDVFPNGRHWFFF